MGFYTLEEIEEDIASVVKKDIGFKSELNVEVVFTKLYSDFVVTESKTDFETLFQKYVSHYSLPKPDVEPTSDAAFTIYYHVDANTPPSKIADCKSEAEFLKTLQEAINGNKVIVIYSSGVVVVYERTNLH